MKESPRQPSPPTPCRLLAGAERSENPGNPRIAARKGATLAAALLLMLLCATVSLILCLIAHTAAGTRAKIERAERESCAAASAARMIRDSMLELNLHGPNVITLICLQAADNPGSVLTLTLAADGYPPAVCKVCFDSDLNLDATVSAGSVNLRLTLPADTPGLIGWSLKNALIEPI